MEPLQSPVVKAPRTLLPVRFSRLALVAGMMLAGLSGCVPESFLSYSTAPEKLPCKIATRWDHDVHFPPDTMNGQPLPTIAGRVTFFAEDLTTPVASEGSMYIYMYDDMPDAVNKTDPIEFWGIDTKTVRSLLRRDAAGWGYTLILPWQKYRPELTHVKIKVRFDRVGGQYPLYSEMIPVTFETATDKPRVTVTQMQTSTIVPGKGVSTQTTAGGVPVSVGQPAMNMPPAGQPAMNFGPGRQPMANGSQSFVDQSNGGSLPTTITKSPPPALGADVPFIVPSRQ